jgi:hypothetical protein
MPIHAERYLPRQTNHNSSIITSLAFHLSIYFRLLPVCFLLLEINTLVGNNLLGVYHSNQTRIHIVYNNYIYSRLILELTGYDHYNNIFLTTLTKLQSYKMMDLNHDTLKLVFEICAVKQSELELTDIFDISKDYLNRPSKSSSPICPTVCKR